MITNRSVHSYFVLFILIHLGEPTVAHSRLLPSPSRDETLGHQMGCNAYSTGAAKLVRKVVELSSLIWRRELLCKTVHSVGISTSCDWSIRLQCSN